MTDLLQRYESHFLVRGRLTDPIPPNLRRAEKFQRSDQETKPLRQQRDFRCEHRLGCGSAKVLPQLKTDVIGPTAYVDDELELIIAESVVAFWTFVLAKCSRLITDPVAFAAVSGTLERHDPKQPGM